MPSDPLAPIAYEQMKEHLDLGGFLRLPNDEAIPKDWRGTVVGLTEINTLIGTAIVCLDEMATDFSVVRDASFDTAQLLGLSHLDEDLQRDEDAILDDQVDQWEHAAAILHAISRATFVC